MVFCPSEFQLLHGVTCLQTCSKSGKYMRLKLLLARPHLVLHAILQNYGAYYNSLIKAITCSLNCLKYSRKKHPVIINILVGKYRKLAIPCGGNRPEQLNRFCTYPHLMTQIFL